MRFFNTAGPVDPARHYALPPLSRFDWEHVRSLIEQQKYFVLHAPRQTGKTSTSLALMARLNQENQHSCLYVNIESAQAARGDVRQGLASVCQTLGSQARYMRGDMGLSELVDAVLSHFEPTAVLAFPGSGGSFGGRNGMRCTKSVSGDCDRYRVWCPMHACRSSSLPAGAGILAHRITHKSVSH